MFKWNTICFYHGGMINGQPSLGFVVKKDGGRGICHCFESENEAYISNAAETIATLQLAQLTQDSLAGLSDDEKSELQLRAMLILSRREVRTSAQVEDTDADLELALALSKSLAEDEGTTQKAEPAANNPFTGSGSSNADPSAVWRAAANTLDAGSAPSPQSASNPFLAASEAKQKQFDRPLNHHSSAVWRKAAKDYDGAESVTSTETISTQASLNMSATNPFLNLDAAKANPFLNQGAGPARPISADSSGGAPKSPRAANSNPFLTTQPNPLTNPFLGAPAPSSGNDAAASSNVPDRENSLGDSVDAEDDGGDVDYGDDASEGGDPNDLDLDLIATDSFGMFKRNMSGFGEEDSFDDVMDGAGLEMPESAHPNSIAETPEPATSELELESGMPPPPPNLPTAGFAATDSTFPIANSGNRVPPQLSSNNAPPQTALFDMANLASALQVAADAHNLGSSASGAVVGYDSDSRSSSVNTDDLTVSANDIKETAADELAADPLEAPVDTTSDGGDLTSEVQRTQEIETAPAAADSVEPEMADASAVGIVPVAAESLETFNFPPAPALPISYPIEQDQEPIEQSQEQAGAGSESSAPNALPEIDSDGTSLADTAATAGLTDATLPTYHPTVPTTTVSTDIPQPAAAVRTKFPEPTAAVPNEIPQPVLTEFSQPTVTLPIEVLPPVQLQSSATTLATPDPTITPPPTVEANVATASVVPTPAEDRIQSTLTRLNEATTGTPADAARSASPFQRLPAIDDSIEINKPGHPNNGQ